MQSQNFFSLIRFSRVLWFSLFVVMLSGLLNPKAAVQTVSLGTKTDFGTGGSPAPVAVGDFRRISMFESKLGTRVALDANVNLASISMYTDRATWAAVAPSVTNINFEGIAPAGGFANYPSTGLTISGLNFVGDMAFSPDVYLKAFSNATSQPTNPFNWGTGDLISGFNSIRVTLPSGVKSVGMEVGVTASRVTGFPTSMLFTVSTGSASQTFTVSAPLAPPLSFVGFNSDEPITSIVINSATFTVLDNFAFAPTPPSCQVNPSSRFHQYGYPNEPNVPEFFGHIPTPNPPPGRNAQFVLCPTRKSGCALCATATMLTSFNDFRQVTPASLDNDLNQLSPVGYGQGTICLNPPCPPNTRLPDYCEFNPAWDRIFEITSRSIRLVDSGRIAPDFIDIYLENHVCLQDRVIIQLDSITTQGQHFVLVTGKSQTASSTTDWNVFDPGWDRPTLSSLLNGFVDSRNNFHRFRIGGVRTYRDWSNLNPSTFSINVNSPVELLVQDSDGLRLGWVGLPDNDIFQIPFASYFRDFPLIDPSGEGPPNGDPTGKKTAYIPLPKEGIYQVRATGTDLGTYTLDFRSMASDGTIQSQSITGVTNTGVVTVYQVLYSSIPGTMISIIRIITFQSTLADIRTSLQIGLINNQGIANSLSRKIEAAADAARRKQIQTSRNILEAFKNEVSAQAGMHISALATQVLREDADSLLSQLP